MTTCSPGRHFVRGDWTRASLYALSPRTVARAARAAPAGRGDDLPLPEPRFGQGARGERTRAITGLLRELTERFTRDAGGRFHAVDDRSRSRPAARRGAREAATASAPYEMGQGVVVFTSGDRSKVVTWEDLVEPELDAEGEPAPGAARLARRGGLPVGAADGHQRRSASASASRPGHGEPDIESLQDGGYAHVRGGAAARRRRRRARVAARRRRGLRRLPRAGRGRADAGVLGRGDRGAARRSSTAAGGCW